MSTPLGDFVRARRDATRPEAIGLPVGPRRRVPGLRRSELAQRAGISVEYLVRIEQGADRNPSRSVLFALGDALALDASDRARLDHLARIADGAPREGVQLGSAPPAAVRSTVLALLNQVETVAAIVTNRLGDVLAHTQGFDLLARPSGLLDASQPNLTRFVFTDPRAHHVFPDWGQLADERVADLWLGPSSTRTAGFLEELALLAGPSFTDRLHRHPRPSNAVTRWIHPQAGQLLLDREVFELPDADAQQLVTFLAADAATATSMEMMRRASVAPLRIAG